jgi:hypothetical protein
MLKPTLLAFCTLVCTTLCAQKLNTKDFEVEARYLQLPNIGLDATFSTYDIKVEGDAALLSKYGYTLMDVKQAMSLDGYNKVAGGGSVSIQVNAGGPSATAMALNTIEKSQDGTKWKEYSYSHDVFISSTYKIIDYKGTTLEDEIVTYSEKISTNSYRTIDEAKSGYKIDFESTGKVNQTLKSILASNIQNMRNQLNYDFGLPTKTFKVNFETLTTKDHPDLGKFDKIKAEVQKAFSLMTPEDNTAFIAAMQPIITFWMEQEKKYDPANKDEKKMNYAMRYNLATGYYWMDDFDNARTYINKIVSGDVSANTGKTMSENLSKFSAKMKKLNRPGQHFKLTLSEEEKARSGEAETAREAAYASGDVRKFDDFNGTLGVTSASKVEPAVLHKKGGVKETGYMVFESKMSAPDFREPKYIRFGKADGRKVAASSLDYATLDSFSIGKQMFNVRDVRISAGVASVEIKGAIVEKIKDYRRTAIVIVHPPFMYAKGLLSTGEELEPDMLMYHKSRKEYLYTDGLMGYVPSMSKNVEDCPAAYDYVKAKTPAPAGQTIDPRLKGFLNTDKIVETLRLYDECGK